MDAMLHPRLKDSVLLIPYESGAIVFDSTSGREFRIGDLETFVCRSLDGNHGLIEIQTELRVMRKVDCQQTVLQKFLDMLRDQRLLVGTGESVPLHLLSVIRDGGRIFVRLMRPGRLLARLSDFFPYAIYSQAVNLTTAMVIVTVGLVLSQSEALHHDLTASLQSVTVVAVSMIMLLTAFIHELAHGLVAKRVGGAVLSVGFGLYLFSPCFFCEVAGVEHLRPRARAQVDSAGMWSDSFFGAVAIWMWAATSGAISRQILATSGVLLFSRVLMNLIPLVKLDGYYVVADLLSRPRLREEALEHIRSLLGNRFVQRDVRIQWPLVLYASASLVYTTLILVLSVVFAWRWTTIGDSQLRSIVLVLFVFAAGWWIDKVPGRKSREVMPWKH